MDEGAILDEWEITLVVRVKPDNLELPPDRWDYTILLDLYTGGGEQAWVKGGGIIRSGTEKDLDSYREEPDE